MADYTGGYTSAVNSEQLREQSKASIKEMMSLMERRQWITEQEKTQQEQEKKAKIAAMGGLSALNAPPQSPMPGQSSQPMAPPMGPPGGMSMAPPPQPPAMGAPGGMSQQGMPPPQGMPQGGMPPPPMNAGAPPQGMPPPGGGMPPPQAGGAPMGMPQGYKPIPGGQFSPGIASPPQPDEKPTLPVKADWMQQMQAAMEKKNVPADEQYNAIMALKPFVEEQHKEQLQKMKEEAEVARAKAAVEVATRARLREERLREQGSQPTAAIKNAEYAKGQGTPESKAAVGKMVDKAGSFAPRKASGGGGGGGPAAAEPEGVDYSKMSPSDPRYNDTKALDQEGRKVQAWSYIVKGVLPYRKGTGGVKDPNVGVMREVARIARENDMTPEEIVNMPAEWKANAQSLAFQTKKVDAIESVLTSFHNNVETWDRLAKGMPPQLGTGALKQGLGKIDFSSVKSINDVKLKLQGEFNDPAVVAYLTAAMAVRMDYARIMQGPQSIASLSEGMKEDAKGIIPNGLNDKSRSALIDTLNADTEGQLKGSKDQLGKIKQRMVGAERGMGKTTEGPKKGDVEDGYRFKGGDPKKKENWEKV